MKALIIKYNSKENQEVLAELDTIHLSASFTQARTLVTKNALQSYKEESEELKNLKTFNNVLSRVTIEVDDNNVINSFDDNLETAISGIGLNYERINKTCKLEQLQFISVTINTNDIDKQIYEYYVLRSDETYIEIIDKELTK